MKKQFVALAIFCSFAGSFLLVLPMRAYAAAPIQLLPFAGIVSYTKDCTCSGTLYIWFAPLYLGGETVITGAMVYSPYKTILYAYYNIGVSGLWHLGDYTPGEQACSIFVGKGCVTLPAIGLMSKVGTNYEVPIQAP